MTDPRIEAAVEAWVSFVEDASLEKIGKKLKINDSEILHGIREGMALALSAADAAAWRPMSEAPRDGTVIEIFQGNRGSWKGIGIATAQYWTAEKLAALEGSTDAAGYEGGVVFSQQFLG